MATSAPQRPAPQPARPAPPPAPVQAPPSAVAAPAPVSQGKLMIQFNLS